MIAQNRLTEPQDCGANVVEVAALVKGDDRYIVLYHHDLRADALKQIGRWASDPDLNFTWNDAAALCQKIRAGKFDKTDWLEKQA